MTFSKKLFLFFYLLIPNLVFSQIPTEIEDVRVFGINKLPARTTVWPSASLDKAQKSTYDNNEWVKSLNGNWSFQWSPEPSKRPIDFINPITIFQVGKLFRCPPLWSDRAMVQLFIRIPHILLK